MKIRFVVTKAQHQSEYIEYLTKGFNAHDIHDISVTQHFHPNEECDLVITWGHRRVDVYNILKKKNIPYLVMERAYIGDRFHWLSLGFNGLNGNADFNNKHITSPDRFNKHFKSYDNPYRIKENGYALVCGQVEGDASHRHIDINTWYRKVVQELNDKNVTVVFRPHPLARLKSEQAVQGLKYTLDENRLLEETLKEARCCVTFSSNSGVISTLAGVPTISYDKISMAYDVSAHNLNNLDYTPDKQLWLNQLSYCQWLPEELESGEAWQHLKTVIE